MKVGQIIKFSNCSVVVRGLSAGVITVSELVSDAEKMAARLTQDYTVQGNNIEIGTHTNSCSCVIPELSVLNEHRQIRYIESEPEVYTELGSRDIL